MKAIEAEAMNEKAKKMKWKKKMWKQYWKQWKPEMNS